MELNEGSLDAQVALGPLSPDLVQSIVRQVLAALTRLHQENKIHGAIRPANLHIDREGNVELAEPSEADEHRSERRGVSPPVNVSPAVSGPAKYLAPELLKPEFGPVGPGVDLYCLGFTALELLKGPGFGALFPGINSDDIDLEIAWMRWHSSPGETLPAACALIPGLPHDLGALLDRLLKKKVQERYPSAAAALRDLAGAPSLSGGTLHRRDTETKNFADEDQPSQPRAAWQTAPPERTTAEAKPTLPFAGTAWFRKKQVVLLLLVLLLLPAAWFVIWQAGSDKNRVTIASMPAGAKVFINQQPLNRATDSTFDLPPGEYTLRLELDGHEPFEGKINVSEQKIHKVTLNKKQPPPIRTVHIASVPRGASVYINDALQQDRTNGDFEVPDGAFKLKLDSPGYKSLEKTIFSSDQLKVALALERIKRTITLVTNPAGADVYIDDKLQDHKTNGAFEVDDAPVTMKLVYKGLPDEVRKVGDPGALRGPLEIVFDRMVTLRSDPPGATFFLDGKEVAAKSPVPMQPGRHKVKALLAGYAPEEKTLDVVELFQEERLTLHALAVHKHALLVGVRQAAKDLPSFVHAEPDVETLGRALQLGGFKADKLSVLTQTRGLTNPGELPTAATIKQRLQVLAGNGAPPDILVVALVGHTLDFPGVTFFAADGANRANPATLVDLSDVLAVLKNAPAQKKLLILDCWRKDWRDPNKLAHVRTWDEPPPPGVTILYGCAVGQTGYEHPSSWHGAFNHFLIHGLLGDAARPQITAPALADYCRQRVAKFVAENFRGMEQVPVLASGDKNGPWAITAPGETTTDYLLGCSLLVKERFDEALEAFNRAEPNLLSFPDLYLQRADARYNKRQFASALADCGTALNMDNTNAAAYAHLGDIQRAATKAAAKKVAKITPKDYAEALKNINKAIELDPECASAYDTRGTIYYSYNAFDAAVKDYALASRLQPRLVLPWINLGLAHAAGRHWDDAIASFDKAIELDNSNANLFAERGTAWSMNGNADRAVQDFSTAIKLENKSPTWTYKPKYKEACYNLGTAYFQQKMYSRAAEALKRAVMIDPNFAEAYRLLSAVYRASGDDTLADMYKKTADKLKK